MAIPNITPLPMPPQRTSAPADWAVRADAFVMAEYNMVQQMNASVIPAMNAATDEIDADVVTSGQNATNAANSATLAGQHRTAAQTAATNAATSETNAANSATTASTAATTTEGYRDQTQAFIGQAENYRDESLEYRNEAEQFRDEAQAIVIGTAIDDTAITATQVRSSLNDSIGNFENVTISGASGSITALQFARITNTTSSSTVTIPASPSEGQIVMVGNMTNRIDHRISVGSIPVKGQNAAGFILIDKALFTVTLKYVNASYGWEVL